ncbi:MAG TPA: hypothetical protein VGC21_00890 [Telluria sp.]|jgi:hypothetical protein
MFICGGAHAASSVVAVPIGWNLESDGEREVARWFTVIVSYGLQEQ